jgi:hypothetical protein
LRHMESSRRFAKALPFHNSYKIAKMTQFHD